MLKTWPQRISALANADSNVIPGEESSVDDKDHNRIDDRIRASYKLEPLSLLSAEQCESAYWRPTPRRRLIKK